MLCVRVWEDIKTARMEALDCRVHIYRVEVYVEIPTINEILLAHKMTQYYYIVLYYLLHAIVNFIIVIL